METTFSSAFDGLRKASSTNSYNQVARINPDQTSGLALNTRQIVENYLQNGQSGATSLISGVRKWIAEATVSGAPIESTALQKDGSYIKQGVYSMMGAVGSVADYVRGTVQGDYNPLAYIISAINTAYQALISSPQETAQAVLEGRSNTANNPISGSTQTNQSSLSSGSATKPISSSSQVISQEQDTKSNSTTLKLNQLVSGLDNNQIGELAHKLLSQAADADPLVSVGLRQLNGINDALSKQIDSDLKRGEQVVSSASKIAANPPKGNGQASSPT